MKVSVLIITLNEEHYVGKLLETLTRQTHKDFEVILVDGNSKDKTVDVASAYSDKLDLHIYKLDKNGIPMQRNYAASKATTEHFCFMDADTLLEPRFLEKIVRSIEKSHPDIIAVWNDPDSKNIIDRLSYDIFNRFMVAVQFVDPVAVGAFTYAKKSAFDAVGGYSENVAIGEDFELARKLFKAGFKYKLLRDPRIKFSVRRVVKMGRIKFILFVLNLSLPYYFKHQSLTNDKYSYDVGNHIKL
jgi:glycosyltransferase involved in cell wall biosynthesis